MDDSVRGVQDWRKMEELSDNLKSDKAAARCLNQPKDKGD